MKTDLRYQNGFLYEHHGAWYVRYRQSRARVIRRALEAIRLPWYGWHALRRGLASNLYEIGAPDKVVQCILRHSKPHVTRERYIKVFDHTVLEAVGRYRRGSKN